MALKTYAQMLEEVQTAISKVLIGQEYEIAGRRMRRADLADLERLEAKYRTLAAREARGGIRVRGVTPY